MYVKKAGKKIFGASFTTAEKKAMDAEIKRQLAEYDRKHGTELDAIILWVLHEQLGFGPKRLRTFYDRFSREVEALMSRYCMGEEDQVWLCTRKLKDIGVDILAWNREERS